MTYYGISGDNAFGIYDDRKRLENSKEYVKNKKILQFDSVYKAFEWARDYYNESQECFDDAYFGEFIDTKINWLLFRSQIRKQNIDHT